MNPTSTYVRLTDVPLWSGTTDTTTWTTWVSGAGTQLTDVRLSNEVQFGVDSMVLASKEKKEASEWDS
jgi:hypothetical protein